MIPGQKSTQISQTNYFDNYIPVEPEYAQYHNGATTFADLTASERSHFENAFKQYQF
jgi:hypothetical protein